MEYLLLIYGDEKAWGSLTPAETGQMHAAYGAYTQALIDAGALRGGNELKPTSAATTVRLVGGKPQVLDGPYAETKEQLGGFYLIDARDLNEAIQVAAKIPPARFGAIEIRPVRELPQV